MPTNEELLAANYYDPPDPWWKVHATPLSAAIVLVVTTLLSVVAYPPFNVAEMGYAFAAPAVLWAYRRPPFKLFAAVTLGSQMIAWTILLGWLHHVTWVGLLLLGPFIGVWVGAWFLAAWWVVPRVLGHATLTRLLALFGLAGLWVVIEWTRTWLLSGFPWLPLAASQWQRASILQVAAFTGAGGVSFVLMGMNIGFAAYAHRLIFEPLKGLNRRSQEFFLAMFLLLCCLAIHVQETANRAGYTRTVGKVGFVQPDVPQAVKWDPSRAPAIREILETTTLGVASRRPDLILWPEAVTPWAVRGDEEVQAWAELLAAQARTPILLGSIAIEYSAATGRAEQWLNGAFLVHPELGLLPDYYAKRRLVPFGEYVPLRPLLGWIGKFVPIGGDFDRGGAPDPLLVNLRDQTLSFGPLICYEDIYGSLARQSVLAGADVLVVLINNNWFGRAGAAYQHAAHSVLRAVETRRPVLRVGNAGWSGWIDEFGGVRAVLQSVPRRDQDGRVVARVATSPTENGTIYFRGSAAVDVTRDARWIGQASFYVQHGNWFVLACAALFGLGLWALKLAGPRDPTVATTRRRLGRRFTGEGDTVVNDDGA